MAPIGALPPCNPLSHPSSPLVLLTEFDSRAKYILEQHGFSCSTSLNKGLGLAGPRVHRRTKNKIQKLNGAYKVIRHFTRDLMEETLQQLADDLIGPEVIDAYRADGPSLSERRGPVVPQHVPLLASGIEVTYELVDDDVLSDERDRTRKDSAAELSSECMSIDWQGLTRSFMGLHDALSAIKAPEVDNETCSTMEVLPADDGDQDLDALAVPECGLVLSQVALLHDQVIREFSGLVVWADMPIDALGKRVQRYKTAVSSNLLADLLVDFYTLAVVDEIHQEELHSQEFEGALSFSAGMAGTLRHAYEHVLMPETLCACASNFGIGASWVQEDISTVQAAVEIFLWWHSRLS